MRLLLRALMILLAVPVVGEAQPSAKMYRIGVLANALDTSDGPTFQAFLEGLRGLGYVQGRNMDIEWRSSEGNAEQLPALAMDLVRAKVDIILATALVPAQAAIEATKTVPIVFVVTADPVGLRLVGSLARPGANATGLASYAPQESSDRVVQLLKTVTPKLSRLGVLTVPSNPAQRELVGKALPSAAQRAGVMLLPLPVQEAGDLPGAFETARGDRADGLYVLGDVLTFVHRARILDLVAKNRLPAIYTNRSAVEAGGLMSYGPNLRDLFRRAATYVDQILKGAKAGEMPVDQSARFELALNLKTAKGLGLSVPPSLVKQAVQVIQ
jgi:putative tryptophan/tyrosine transport system substrate-binding protein